MTEHAWRGDLHRFSVRSWAEDTEVAAVVVVRGADAALWLNLKHVHPDQACLVWCWGRHAACCRPPTDVLFASDLPVRAEDNRETAEAE